MKARSDTLKLGWRVRTGENDRICKLCKKETETLAYFLTGCHKLQNKRNEYIELQWPMTNEKDQIIKRMLLFDKNSSAKEKNIYIDMLWELWKERKRQYRQTSV